MSTRERYARLIDPKVAEAIGELKDPNHQAVLAYLLRKKALYPLEIARGLELLPDTVKSSLDFLTESHLANCHKSPDFPSDFPLGIYTPTAASIKLVEELTKLNRSWQVLKKSSAEEK